MHLYDQDNVEVLCCVVSNAASRTSLLIAASLCVCLVLARVAETLLLQPTTTRQVLYASVKRVQCSLKPLDGIYHTGKHMGLERQDE